MEISIPVSQQHGGWIIGARKSSSTVRFADRGHEQYYCCITNKIKEKEKLKKMKTETKTKEKKKKSCVNGLSKKQKLELLKTFSDSFTAVSDSENPVLGYQIQTDELTEAAEMFLKKLKEMRMNEESSSSSSSSSNESDCDHRSVVSKCGLASPPVSVAPTTTSMPSVSVSRSSESPEAAATATATVEVCMGGKCRKSGGEALMAELKRQTEEIQTQTQVTVTACKCMGKCRSAPNVRVSSSSNNESIEIKSNPLMIGLTLDHVPSILHSLFPQPPPIMS